MTALPFALTATGLPRLRDEDELEIQAQGGQTLRLQPQGQLSREAMLSLLSGTVPADAPQILGPDLSPVSTRRSARDPITGAELSPLSEDELVEIGAARRDPSTGHLVRPGKGSVLTAPRGFDTDIAAQEVKRRRLTQERLDAVREQEHHQRAVKQYDQEYEQIDKTLRAHGATEAEYAQAIQALNAAHPEAIHRPPPSRIVQDLLEDKYPELKRASLIDMRKEYETTRDPKLIPEISARMEAIYGTGEGVKWEKQEADRRSAERTDLNQQYKVRSREAHLGATFTIEEERVVSDTWRPFDEVREMVPIEFGINDKNPYPKNSEQSRIFEQKRSGAKLQLADKLLALNEELFGSMQGAERPESVAAVEAEQKAAEQAGAVIPPPAEGPRYPQFSPQESQQAIRTGRLRYGQPFYDADGKLRRYNRNGTTTVISQ